MNQSHCQKDKPAPVFGLEEPRHVPMKGGSSKNKPGGLLQY